MIVSQLETHYAKEVKYNEKHKQFIILYLNSILRRQEASGWCMFWVLAYPAWAVALLLLAQLYCEATLAPSTRQTTWLKFNYPEIHCGG